MPAPKVSVEKTRLSKRSINTIEVLVNQNPMVFQWVVLSKFHFQQFNPQGIDKLSFSATFAKMAVFS